MIGVQEFHRGELLRKVLCLHSCREGGVNLAVLRNLRNGW